MFGFSGMMPWIVVAIALAVMVGLLVRTVWSIRQVAHKPVADVKALRLHDEAAGGLGRVAAAAAALISTLIFRSNDLLVGGVPLWIGGAVAIVVLIGIEQRWPVPGGTVREVVLQPRRLIEILPRSGTVIASVGMLISIGMIMMCGLVDAPVTPAETLAGSQWPSWQQTSPALIGSAAVLALGAVAIALLLRRPALAGFSREADLRYRRAGADRIMRVVSVLAFLEAGMLFNQVRNAALETLNGPVPQLLRSISLALLLVAAASIALFRVRPPKQLRSAAASPRSVAHR